MKHKNSYGIELPMHDGAPNIKIPSPPEEEMEGNENPSNNPSEDEPPETESKGPEFPLRMF